MTDADLLLDYFVGNTTDHAYRYNKSSGETSYARTGRPVTVELLAQHVEGKYTIIPYVSWREDGKDLCKLIAYDIDYHDLDGDKLQAAMKTCREHDIPAIVDALVVFGCDRGSIYVDESERGFHVFVLLACKTMLADAYWFGHYMQGRIPQLKGCEVFPKQEKITTNKKGELGYGNGIRIPRHLTRAEFTRTVVPPAPRKIDTPDIESLVADINARLDIPSLMPGEQGADNRWPCIQGNTKTPSMVFYPPDHWYCFKCNVGGDALQLHAHVNGLSRKDAFKHFLTEFGLGKPAKKEDVVEPLTSDVIASLCIAPSEYRVKQTGVIQVDSHLNKKGETIEEIKDLAKWTSFKVTKLIEAVDGIQYEMVIDGRPYVGALEDIVKATRCEFGCSAHYSNVMGVILKHVIKVVDPPRLKMRQYFGFHPDGWHFDSMVDAFDHDDLQRNMIKMDISKVAVDKEAAVKAFLDLYNASSIDYNPIITAYGLVMPFLHVLALHTDLAPMLGLGGEADAGKSKKCDELTQKWWGFPSARVTNSNIVSPSRLASYLTGFTMGILFDEVDKFPEDHIGKLKTVTSGTARDPKKGRGAGGQGLVCNKEYCTPVCMTYNYRNPLYDDPAAQERTLDLQISSKNTKEGVAIYTETYERVPDALIGRYIIERTKDWTFDTLRALYKKAPDCPCPPNQWIDSRIQKIFKIIWIGAWMAREFFGLLIPLDDLPDILLTSRSTGSNDIIDAFDEWCGDVKKRDFDDKYHGWTVGTMATYTDKKTQHVMFAFRTGAATDISKRVGRKIQLPQLAAVLKKVWKRVEYRNTKINAIGAWWVIIDETLGRKEALRQTELTDEPLQTLPTPPPANILESNQESWFSKDDEDRYKDAVMKMLAATKDMVVIKDELYKKICACEDLQKSIPFTPTLFEQLLSIMVNEKNIEVDRDCVRGL